MDVGDVVEVMAPVKHGLAVSIQVPVKEVGGGMWVHVTVGDEAHVGVARPDRCKEGDVVLYIPGLSTILQGMLFRPSFVTVV